jgi:hypothetical protein
MNNRYDGSVLLCRILLWILIFIAIATIAAFAIFAVPYAGVQ